MPDQPPCDLAALLTLHLVPGLGPRLTRALLERFGTAARILAATPDELRTVPHIGDRLADSFARAMRAVDLQRELDLVARHQVQLVPLGSPTYPEPLATLADAPPLFYMRGTLRAEDGKAVALVGSRRCTAYGKRVAERLALELARAGYTVVSGLARGIDAAAHRGALAAGGRTLAVLAGGLSRIYPPEHGELARAVEAAGALLSEASMDQEPLPGMFPARNRLISGLSRGVVIVEAAARSGALITARHAAEQGRHVFAVPGPIDSDASAGALQLLRDGAVLVRGAEDILEELEGIKAAQPAAREPAPALEPLERSLWDLLAGGPRHLDVLTQQLGLPVAQVSSTLLLMEMKKLVQRLPGNQYARR